MTKGLFSTTIPNAAAPLADRLRPQQLGDVVGQEHLLAEDGILGRMVASGHFASLILWGPPGCGKTTLARLVASQSGAELLTLSAITSGVADLKKAFDQARLWREQGKRTCLFVDEIHRFHRAQHDAFLPVVEDGTILLIGATTENPSFELNAALLSRCKVVVLNRLDDTALDALLLRAETLHGSTLPLTDEARATLRNLADGDGRYLLNLAEDLFTLLPPVAGMGNKPSKCEARSGGGSEAGVKPPSKDKFLDVPALIKRLQQRAPLYDKNQEGHYNLISALHKAVRGSDVQAALYWFSRMLDGGEDPRFLARRLIRMAVEDIGLAEPQALQQAIAAKDAYEFLGSPEGELALSQAVIFLAMSPKSNAGYVAYKAARKDAKTFGSLMPPAPILNAPTKLMQEIGYGAGYQYDPDTKDGFSGQNYFPEPMGRKEYYTPVERGFEREMKKRLDYWDALRKKR
jgi:putative ATPase